MRRHKILTVFFLVLWTLAAACDDDPDEPPAADPPVANSVTPNPASPGDTVVISGSNFAGIASENTIRFRNPLAETTPFQMNDTQLRVVVDRDATSGRVTVSTDGGSDTTDSLEVQRGVGDVFVYGGTGASNRLSLPNPGAATTYLVVPHSANSNASVLTNHGYRVNSSTVTPAAMVAEKAPRKLHTGSHEWFESQRWTQTEKLVERYGRPRGEFQKKPVMEAAPAGGGFRQFYVLRTTTGDQNAASSYSRITAQLRYSGSKCLVYADVETLTTGNFTQAHFNQFGQTFDNSIEATNVTYFGSYSDVDGNGKMIMLVSPVVNRLQEPACSPPDGPCDCGFIAGFFNPRDLYDTPPVPAGTTNHAEIIYLLAADPTGQWDCSFPVVETASENLGTIPHEHEHLTSFSHRIFSQDAVTQVTWFEEGMAHMAEDLNGDNSSNIGRGRLYRQDPGNISLEDNSAPLEQRGGIYLMLRLLVDRYGTGILKTIVQSKCTGRACIQNATGLGFYDAVGEFLAAQYLSGRGITDDERYNYQSIDLDDFGALTVNNHVAGGPAVNGTVKRSAGDFHIFSGVLGTNSVFEFTPTSGDPVLRSVIVRLQ